MKTGLLAIGICICVAWSCIRELPFDGGQFEPELVVNSLLSPDSVMAVYVHQTAPLDESTWVSVSDAKVYIHELGRGDTILLSYKEGGRYEADRIYPEVCRIYELRVDAGSLGQARAIDTVPPSPVVWGAALISTGIIDQQDYELYDFQMNLENAIDQTAYWELLIVANANYISDNRYQMSIMNKVAVPDRVILAEGYLEFDPKAFIFSNQLIDSAQYTVKMRLANAARTLTAPNPFPLANLQRKSAVLLRRTSSAYFQHQKAWIIHHYNQPIGSRIDNYLRLLFAGEPTPLYSNVEGAHGVFASFSSVVVEMTRR